MSLEIFLISLAVWFSGSVPVALFVGRWLHTQSAADTVRFVASSSQSRPVAAHDLPLAS
jgi:hypothetical protein